ncbi:unnamed protein product [Ceratitis capitata]|uniref:(Mediterranean fruit fly) hypothetical protein n=1 Tax=Ceratitis capitata TaxID=7213 RepID=A0A811UU84_CERCA|nr:unnamed protein product [Ceratitis capitata]
MLQRPQCGSHRSALWPACRDKNYEENNVNVGDDIVDGADDIGATLCGRRCAIDTFFFSFLAVPALLHQISQTESTESSNDDHADEKKT